MEAIRKWWQTFSIVIFSITNLRRALIFLVDLLVPYKEVINNVARKRLADSESQVTATASKITQTLTWWP